MISDRARTNLHHGLEPFRKARGVPMQNDALKKGAANHHHKPVSVQSRALSRRGNVIKRGHTMTKSAPNRLRAVPQEQNEFAYPQIADVLQLLGKAGIDVVAINIMG